MKPHPFAAHVTAAVFWAACSWLEVSYASQTTGGWEVAAWVSGFLTAFWADRQAYRAWVVLRDGTKLYQCRTCHAVVGSESLASHLGVCEGVPEGSEPPGGAEVPENGSAEQIPRGYHGPMSFDDKERP